MHMRVEPAIFYAGTPVVLISTLNQDGSFNISPMSSAWWLGWSCMIGLDASSKTTQNMVRTGECVLNLASVDMVEAVDRLALLSGSDPLPMHKKLLGYRTEHNKYAESGLTPQESEIVAAPRILESSLQLEARVANVHEFAKTDSRMAVPTMAIELAIVAAHADPKIITDGHEHRIDPDKWRPLMMNFRQFYGLGEKVQSSRLAKGPEEMYAPWKFKQA